MAKFIAIIGMGISAVILLILAEPYRIRRVTSFWNPRKIRSVKRLSADAVADGFLVAVRYGARAGNSVQKLSICAVEAHQSISSSPLLGRTGLYRCGIGAFNGILRRFRAMSIGRKALRLTTVFPDFSVFYRYLV